LEEVCRRRRGLQKQEERFGSAGGSLWETEQGLPSKGNPACASTKTKVDLHRQEEKTAKHEALPICLVPHYLLLDQPG
jgi:hypothetical protein